MRDLQRARVRKRAVPATASVAGAAVAPGFSTARFVFGARAASTTPPGTRFAAVTFDVVAPNA